MANSQTISSLFKISGHETRIELLKALKQDDMSASDISEVFGTTPAYVHRHLQILAEGGLIEKNGKNFSLSSIGKIFINSLGWGEVISMYNDFWKSHSLLKVPEIFIEDMYVFKSAKMISPAPKVIDKIKCMVSNANEKILSVIDRSTLISYSDVLEKIKIGVEFYHLSGSILPNCKKNIG